MRQWKKVHKIKYSDNRMSDNNSGFLAALQNLLMFLANTISLDTIKIDQEKEIKAKTNIATNQVPNYCF